MNCNIGVMDFALSDEQQMLVHATQDLLQDHAGPEAVRALLDSAERDPKLWAFGTELGWTGLALPEAQGGSGQGLVETALVAIELGAAAARGPFVPTALVGAAVARSGDAALMAEVLPGLAAGTHAAAVSVNGSMVQDAAEARWLLVVGPDGQRLHDRFEVRRQRTLDLTRPFFAVTPAGGRPVAGDQQRTLDEAAVLTAADALGAGRRLLDLTVEYVKVRTQFGRVIGSFQAVKHKCATMRIALHGAQAAVAYAAMALDAGAPDASRAASAAKAYTCEAMSELAGEALQLHGGIGFTWEHDLHLLLRRIKTDEVLFGDIATHQARLCDLLVTGR
jgi:alkylation response protein AidB-like acyl-CoA dehydrogenase